MNFKSSALSILFFCICFPIFGQSNESEKTSIEEMSKKRQDPVSGLRSVFLQEVLLPVADGTASSFSIQPVYPFKLASNLKLITYTIIPFQTVPPLFDGGTHEGGMGNILFNGYFGKNGQIDHPIPVQIDHLFRLKLTTQFRSKLTT